MTTALFPRALLLGLVICLASATVWASGARRSDDMVVFGDSLSDPGNAFVLTGEVSIRPFELIPDAPYAIGGLHFSNGKTWVEQLAGKLGARRSARPAFRLPGVFSNYAVASARAGGNGPVDLTNQVLFFLSVSPPPVSAEARYVMWIGGNDVRDALEALASDSSGETSAAIIGRAVTAISDNITVLVEAGARKFLVPNSPNIGLIPAVTLLGPGAAGLATDLAAAFNGALGYALDQLETALPIEIVRLDTFRIISEIVADPAAAGLTNAEDSCITPGVIRRAICRKPREYLYWDGIHPTRAGHAIVAAEALEALSAATAVAQKSRPGGFRPIPRFAD